MTIKIELAGQQAASLKAKAAEEGVTVEHWLRRLVERETSGRKSVTALLNSSHSVIQLRRCRTKIGRGSNDVPVRPTGKS